MKWLELIGTGHSFPAFFDPPKIPSVGIQWMRTSRPSTQIPAITEDNKEIWLNTSEKYDGNWKNFKMFLNSIVLYLGVNRKTCKEDEAQWWCKHYITTHLINKEFCPPSYGVFMEDLKKAFSPTDNVGDSMHQIKILKQGNRMAKEVITEIWIVVLLSKFGECEGYHVKQPISRSFNSC